jgi:hypothetical protein
MAKTTPAAPATSESLAVIPGLEGMISTQRPEGADEGQLGNEGIGRDDITIPRLALAQKTSPEIDSTSARYIEGLTFTDLFGSISKKIYGKGPVYFAVLRVDRPRFVEFIPMDEGGGIRNPNVPAMIDGKVNPKTQFGEIDPATKRAKKPVATKFYDFIILVLNDLDFNDPMQNVMALSLKSSAIPVAKQLNLYINQRGKKKLYKGLYELRTSHDIKDKNTFAVYKVKNAGWLKPGTPVEVLAEEMFENWKDRVVNIDIEGEHEEDTSFDTEAMDANQSADTGGM